MSLFDDISFEINCPECDTEISIFVKQIGSSMVCPKCHVTINLKDDGLTKELQEAEKSLNDLFA